MAILVTRIFLMILHPEQMCFFVNSILIELFLHLNPQNECDNCFLRHVILLTLIATTLPPFRRGITQSQLRSGTLWWSPEKCEKSMAGLSRTAGIAFDMAMCWVDILPGWPLIKMNMNHVPMTYWQLEKKTVALYHSFCLIDCKFSTPNLLKIHMYIFRSFLTCRSQNVLQAFFLGVRGGHL